MKIIDKKRYTIDEYFAKSIVYSRHCELVDGDIVAFASPTPLHQDIAGNIYSAIRNHIKKNNGSCKVFIAPLDVVIDNYNVTQPDVFIVCDPSKIDGRRCNGVPDFVVEVLSTNRKDDLIRKLGLYSDNGVREYWIVDPENEKTLVYFFDKNDLPSIYTFDTDIPINIYDGKVSINIAGLLA